MANEKRLSDQAVDACVDVFNEFSEDEAKAESAAIYEAWKVGRDVEAGGLKEGEYED